MKAKNFYLAMGLLIAAIVVYGFSHTVDKNLLHATQPRPFVLYIHVAVFSIWVIFYIVQAALVRVHKVRLHRMFGWLGAVIGILVPTLGISTAVVMAHFNVVYKHIAHPEADLIVQFCDMLSFTLPFAIAIFCRKRINVHRRLMFIATCTLTSAAFGRFPIHFLSEYFYLGVDALVFCGVLRDLMVEKRVHAVYLYSLMALAIMQISAMSISVYGWSSWSRIAQTLF